MPLNKALHMLGLAYYHQAEIMQKFPYQPESPRFGFENCHLYALQDEFELTAHSILAEDYAPHKYNMCYSYNKQSRDFRETFLEKLSQKEYSKLNDIFANTLEEIIRPIIGEDACFTYPLRGPSL